MNDTESSYLESEEDEEADREFEYTTVMSEDYSESEDGEEEEDEDEDEECLEYAKPKGTGSKKRRRDPKSRKPRMTYSSLEYSGRKFKVGESVIVAKEEGRGVVQIKEIYVEDGDKDKNVYIWARCYNTQKDLKYKKLKKGELVTSSTYRAFLAESIERNATVFSNEKEMKRAKHDPENSFWKSGNSRNVFFCSSFRERKICTIQDESMKSSAGEETSWENAFATAIDYLQLSYVPGVLPCREYQRGQIKTFLDKAIRAGGTGGGLYISGMPGTGKTATLHQVVRELEIEGLDFRYIEVNMMKLPTPKHVYSEIYRQWGKRDGLKQTQKIPSPPLAARLLEQMFTNKAKVESHTVTVLLIDELDYLMTRNEQVVYNLFNWPSQKHARLAVVGIANTMNLIEQFGPRVQSRVGLQRVKFAPYNKMNIAEICQSRIEQCKVFDRDAINFCATKVASVSGDIRRALQILRRAARIVWEEIQKDPKHEVRLVGMREIKAAVKDLFDSSDMLILGNMGLVPGYLLVTLVYYLNMNRCTSCPLHELHRRTNQNLSMKGHPEFSLDEFEDLINSLSLQRVVFKEYNLASFKRDVRLNVKVEYVVDAFRSNPELNSILATIRI